MKKRSLSFTMAICMVFLLTMTSCPAAEVPAVTGNTARTSKTQGVSIFTDAPADASASNEMVPAFRETP